MMLVPLAGCSSTKTARAVLVDPNGGWEVELPGTVTHQVDGDVDVWSARYGRDYYGVVDVTMDPALTVNLDDDANNAINSSRDAIGAVATERVITATTIDGFDARRFTANLSSGNDSATLTGVIVNHNGHVVSAIITDGKSNSADDVQRFIASFVLH